MTWTQGWRPKQPTLLRLACRLVADDARLGDVFPPRSDLYGGYYEKAIGVAPEIANTI